MSSPSSSKGKKKQPQAGESSAAGGGRFLGVRRRPWGRLRRRDKGPLDQGAALAWHVRHGRGSRPGLRPGRPLDARLARPHQLRVLRHAGRLLRDLHPLPDEPQQQNFSPMFANSAPRPAPTPQLGAVTGCHYSAGGFDASAWSASAYYNQQADATPYGSSGAYSQCDYDNVELPPLPSDLSGYSGSSVSDTSNYGYGDADQGTRGDPSNCSADFHDPAAASSGLSSGGNGPYFGFDSTEEYVHSPLFSRMPPVSDSIPDSFNLGGSYFF
ncbi:AP2/ERF domain-containing protein [Psidium guajava]|nr:AP2/ERF domain-containing protein [Psidium guajava]